MTLKTATSSTPFRCSSAARGVMMSSQGRFLLCGTALQDGLLQSDSTKFAATMYFTHGLSYVAKRFNGPRELGGFLSSDGDVKVVRELLSRTLSGFPNDGEVEEITKDGDRCFRYIEGPKDRAFMEQKDREYLTALRESDRPEDRVLFEEEIGSLDLSIEHHRQLRREFEPFAAPLALAIQDRIPDPAALPEVLALQVDESVIERDHALSLSTFGEKRYHPEALKGAILTVAEVAGCYSEVMPSLTNEAFKQTYLGRRLNAFNASPELIEELWASVRCDFPCDGFIEYIGKEEGYHCFRYWEGPKDRIFMQALDTRYVTSLAATTSVERITANLDFKQTHHQTLYKQFATEPAPTYEAAGGGGSGGGKTATQPASIVDVSGHGLIDFYDTRLGPRLKTSTWGLWLSADDEHESEHIVSGASDFKEKLAVWYAKSSHDKHPFLRSYVGQRLNVKPPTDSAQEEEWQRIIEAFPADGRIERIGKQGDFYEYRYVEGPKDKAFMEEQDARYLEQLAGSADQEDKVLLNALIQQLDLTRPHHQRLQEIYLKNPPPAKLKTGTKGQRDITRLRPPHRLTQPAVIAGCRFLGRSEAADFTVIFVDTYMGQRLNIKAFNQPTSDQQWHAIVDGFPGDGWCVPTDREGNHYRYFEGPRDKLYMEWQDKRYMKELVNSGDPEDKITLAQLITNLDTRSAHHRELRRLFQPRPGRTSQEVLRTGTEEDDPNPHLPLSVMEETMRELSAGLETRLADLETASTALGEGQETHKQRMDELQADIERERRQEEERVIARQADEIRRLREALQHSGTSALPHLFCRRQRPAALEDAEATHPTSPPASPRGT